jgi:hypothetical protein
MDADTTHVDTQVFVSVELILKADIVKIAPIVKKTLQPLVGSSLLPSISVAAEKSRRR